MTYRRPAPTCLALAISLALALGAAASPAQMPSTDDMARATAVVEPLARQHQVALRIGTLWLAALRERAPLVAAFGRGVCQLGYSAYTPGRDYRWLFPTLAPAQREVWLAGLVQHELAHCLEQAAQAGAVVASGAPTSATPSATPSATTAATTAALTPTPAPAAVQAAPPAALPSTPQAATDGGPGQRWHEVLADLAFAVHVDQHSPQGDTLIRQLAQLRAAQAGNDPVHNSAAELLCYLRQADRSASPEPWLARLQRLRVRCWQGAYPAAAGTEPGATAGFAPGLIPGLNPGPTWPAGSGANTGSFSGSARLASGGR